MVAWGLEQMVYLHAGAFTLPPTLADLLLRRKLLLWRHGAWGRWAPGSYGSRPAMLPRQAQVAQRVLGRIGQRARLAKIKVMSR